MNRVRVMGLLCNLLLTLTSAYAGEVVITDFSRPELRPEVLQHIQLKGLVAEFMDKEKKGLGTALGYLIWREILTAISDQAGAGVVLARSPTEQRLVDLLDQDYHTAAVQVAQHQKARMVAWGVIQEEGEYVYAHTYLTLLPKLGGTDLILRLQTGKREIRGLETPLIPRTRFNFTPVQTSRQRLFDRYLVTRQRTPLRARPDREALVRTRVAAGTVLHSNDMTGAWFAIEHPSHGRVYASVHHVEVPPRQVESSATNVNLRAGPGKHFRALRKASLRGRFDVLDMRYHAGRGLWYRLNVHGTHGWVSAVLVRPRFSLPVVHFMAGLYRYQAKRYQDAAREFAQFTTAAGSEQNNVTLATAYQLLGASRLMTQPNRASKRASLADFSRAVTLTPYDPTAYSVRALASLGIEQSLLPTLADLEHALKLDTRNVQALTLVRILHNAAESRVLRPFMRGDSQRTLQRLQKQYAIRP